MAELAKKIYIYPAKLVNIELEEKWVQPVLTSNSSIVNGNSFGVSCNSYSSNSSSASGDIYKAFDSDKTGTYWRSGTSTGWFSFYSSVALKVKSIELTPYYSYPMTGTVEVSSNGTTWSKIKDWTNTKNATFTIEVNSDNYYKYYKVNITKISRDVIHCCNVAIDAVTKKVTQESNSSAKLYTTINEVGSEYIMSNIDGITCYTSLGSNSDIRATNGKVSKNNKVYSILRTGKPPYNRVSWNTAGTYTFTVPEGVSRVLLSLAGAGGGGGGYACNEYDECCRGGDGGRGNLVYQYISVQQSQTYSIIVGLGGTAGRSNIHIGTYNYRGDDGGKGGTSSAFGVLSYGGNGGAGATIDGSTHGDLGSASDGANAGNGQGGTGGIGGTFTFTSGGCSGDDSAGNFKGATNGSDGWCIIEYGGSI